MKSIDKFGHYRGYHGVESRVGARGPQGEGFVLNAEGNYDMENKRLTNVGKGVNLDDALTVGDFSKLVEHVDRNGRALVGLQKNFSQTMVGYFDVYTKETIQPKLNGTKLELIQSMKESLKEIFEIHTRDVIKPLISEKTEENRKKIEAQRKKLEEIETMKKELVKVKDETKAELKALTDVTRAFVYKVTTPGYIRSSEEGEKNIRKKLKEKQSTWREVFPEVS